MESSISPLDGRYYSRMSRVRNFFSESSLIQSRIQVEISYVVFLGKILNFPTSIFQKDIDFNLSETDLNEIKNIEKKIHHDVKSVEVFLRNRYKSISTHKEDQKIIEWIHFGLTSQDINHLAFLKLYQPFFKELIKDWTHFVDLVEKSATEWMSITMLSHTHGQPATPTTLGHTMMVFVDRWRQVIAATNNLTWSVKFGGATGGLNAHYHVYPNIDWKKEFDSFILDQGFTRQQWTTQIDHYDSLCESFDCLSRLATISIDFCRDIWSYISINYIGLKKLNSEQVGSSTMPHKVNPIHFEQSEGNLMLAVNLLQFFSRKLPISRMQRDLTDSTVGRNIGVAMGHLELSLQSMKTGFLQLTPSEINIERDLEDHPEIWGETIQTYLRAIGYPNPYDLLKQHLQSNTDKVEIKSTLRKILLLAKKEKSQDPDSNLIEFEKLLNLLP